MSAKTTSDKAHEPQRDQYGMSPADYAALDALTDEEIHAAALADPDNPPLTPEQLARFRRVSPAKFIRHKLGMSLEAFADAFGIPAATLRAWERHEAEPSPAELTYLRTIGQGPDDVRRLVRESVPA